MATTAMAYGIRVAEDVHHRHYQYTAGRTAKVNENITNSTFLEYDYDLCHHYGDG